uniref:DNA topoisomerase n=1 Tax=Chrysotila carterae TaxID=13221 RepID=A0A7S4BQU2_CHRCT
MKQPRSGAVVNHLQQEARGCVALVLWLDCDREGENICFEVMHAVADFLPKSREQCVFRARFSSVGAEALRTALSHAGVPDACAASAVDARQELDLKVGVAFTRLQTIHFRAKYRGLNAAVVSYGPCQTPTLGFVVQRHLERLCFVSETFWKLRLSVHAPGSSSEAAREMAPSMHLAELSMSTEEQRGEEEIGLTWERGRLFDQRVALALLQLARRATCARVLAIDDSDELRPRPVAMNTIAMLKAASTVLGLGAKRAMSIAEDLYLSGYLSYPRTESSGFTRDFDFVSVLTPHAAHDEWGAHVQWLLAGNWVLARKGVDVGDHPPLTPLRPATREQLGHDAWRLYKLVALAFLAAVSPDARVRTRTVRMCAGGEHFSAAGLTLLEAGWFRIQPHRAPAEYHLPHLAVGEELEIARLELESGETQSPPPISEAELIGQMESHGIGTDASIASHIANIESRKYVRLLERPRAFEPTPLGLALVQGYRRIDAELVAPAVRTHVERQLALVASGAAARAHVVAHCLDEFKRKFRYFAAHIHRMDELFAASFGNGGGGGGGGIVAGGRAGFLGGCECGHSVGRGGGGSDG